MIYIRPNGALGNMFFHIAAIWTLAKDNEDILYLVEKREKIQELIDDKRCELGHAKAYSYLLNRFPALQFIPWKTGFRKIFHYPFEYTLPKYKNGYLYDGYFQCEKYFKHRRGEILELFKPDKKFFPEINKYAQYFGHVHLHVRRGDYLTLPKFHPVLSMDYYDKALAMLPKDLKVLVFSDDLPWCRENFIGGNFIFVDEMDYICVYIMTKMKYHIIANSSFSWWGAWMSTYSDKVVIAPERWVGEDAPDDKDIIPKEWIKI